MSACSQRPQQLETGAVVQQGQASGPSLGCPGAPAVSKVQLSLKGVEVP